jgi:hypothetical protein
MSNPLRNHPIGAVVTSAVIIVLAALGVYRYYNTPISNLRRIYVGQVDWVHYSDRSTGNPTQTSVTLKSGDSVELCGDQERQLAVGSNYRLELRQIVDRANSSADSLSQATCDQIIAIESIPREIDLGSVSGHIISAEMNQSGDHIYHPQTTEPSKAIALDASGLGKRYSFTVHIEDGNHSRQALPICDDLLGEWNDDPFDVFEGIAGEHRWRSPSGAWPGMLSHPPIPNSPWNSVTLFFNKTAKSERFGCFPLLAIGNDESGVVVPSHNLGSLYPERQEALMASFLHSMQAFSPPNGMDVYAQGGNAPAPAQGDDAHLTPHEIIRNCKADPHVKTVTAELAEGTQSEMSLYDCGTWHKFLMVSDQDRNELCSVDFTLAIVDDGFNIGPGPRRVTISTTSMQGSGAESPPWTVVLTVADGKLTATSEDNFSPKIECER